MTTAVVWFRRDLRLADNTALINALQKHDRVVGVYALDDAILCGQDIGAARVAFLLEALQKLSAQFAAHGGQLIIKRNGPPEQSVLAAAREAGANALYFNRDYTPYSRARDTKVTAAARAAGLSVSASDDALLVAPDGVVDPRDGRPFITFTPFKRTWETFLKVGTKPNMELLWPRLRLESPFPSDPMPTLADYGLSLSQDIPDAGEDAAQSALQTFVKTGLRPYADNRDNTADDHSTSRLSVHLKWGTLSVRDCFRAAIALGGRGADKWVDELAWRDFFNTVLWHHPKMLTEAIQPALRAMRFDTNDEYWTRWTSGTTGYPYVDAGMRQLNATGWMHNRTRQVAASFLCKDLLLDWRPGAAYYMEHLVDGDWASNYGGWQWVAGTAPDPNGNFRVFNPTAQQRKYDPNMEYCRYWIPELGTPDYPKPMVDHSRASEEFIRRFQKAFGPPPSAGGRRR